MKNYELVQWQKLDDNGMPMPWLTHNCLDYMKQQDWSQKTVLMFGAGLGDAWLADRCKHLFVVERNWDWLLKARQVCSDFGITNVTYIYEPLNDCSGEAEKYARHFILKPDIDIVINDDAYRTEICQYAVDYFKEKGGILICDNWYQAFVWISDKAVEIMQPYMETAEIFEQADHTDNDGVNKWKTAVFFINT